MSHKVSYGWGMTKIISVRSDAELEAALAQLGTAYGNRTDTVRAAILHLADEKRGQRLREESLAAANDPADLAETRAVMAEMEDLRAWWTSYELAKLPQFPRPTLTVVDQAIGQ